jgi:hypothetical protein
MVVSGELHVPATLSSKLNDVIVEINKSVLVGNCLLYFFNI